MTSKKVKIAEIVISLLAVCFGSWFFVKEYTGKKKFNENESKKPEIKIESLKPVAPVIDTIENLFKESETENESLHYQNSKLFLANKKMIDSLKSVNIFLVDRKAYLASQKNKYEKQLQELEETYNKAVKENEEKQQKIAVALEACNKERDSIASIKPRVDTLVIAPRKARRNR